MSKDIYVYELAGWFCRVYAMMAIAPLTIWLFDGPQRLVEAMLVAIAILGVISGVVTIAALALADRSRK